MNSGQLTNIRQDDWFAINLTANHAYELVVSGCAATAGPMTTAFVTQLHQNILNRAPGHRQLSRCGGVASLRQPQFHVRARRVFDGRQAAGGGLARRDLWAGVGFQPIQPVRPP